MKRHPVFIEDGDRSPHQRRKKPEPPHPAPEEDLGGGDICSLEDRPSTDDDRPLD